MKRAIITSASNLFFPSLINLLGSIKKNYPNHPHVFVYDLGLSFFFRRELELISNVSVIDLPNFCNHWRSCYTWKCYIFSNPLADLNFYLDAGNQVLKPLDGIFKEIEKNGYFTVEIIQELSEIVPKDYYSLFGLDSSSKEFKIIQAGIFGFKNNYEMNEILKKIYDAGIAGLALGFSRSELYRNKGVNKNIFIRDCKCFRHDQTLLNILLRKNISHLKTNSYHKYSNLRMDEESGQIIWNLRRLNSYEYLDRSLFLQKENLLSMISWFAISLIIILTKIKRFLFNFLKG